MTLPISVNREPQGMDTPVFRHTLHVTVGLQLLYIWPFCSDYSRTSEA